MKTQSTLLFAAVVVIAGLVIFQLVGRNHELQNDLASREFYFRVREAAMKNLAQTSGEIAESLEKLKSEPSQHAHYDNLKNREENFVYVFSRARVLTGVSSATFGSWPSRGDIRTYEKWLKGSEPVLAYFQTAGMDARSFEIFHFEIFGSPKTPRKFSDYSAPKIGERRLGFLQTAVQARQASFGQVDPHHHTYSMPESWRQEGEDLKKLSAEDFRQRVIDFFKEGLGQEVVAPESRFQLLAAQAKLESIRSLFEGRDTETGVTGLGLLNLWRSPQEAAEIVEDWKQFENSLRPGLSFEEVNQILGMAQGYLESLRTDASKGEATK